LGNFFMTARDDGHLGVLGALEGAAFDGHLVHGVGILPRRTSAATLVLALVLAFAPDAELGGLHDLPIELGARDAALEDLVGVADLLLDDLLEVRDGLGPPHVAAVDEESRDATGAQATHLLHVLGDLDLQAPVVDVLFELLHVQTHLLGVGDELRLLELALVLPDDVVVRPELALLVGRLARHGGEPRVPVIRQRVVHEHQAHIPGEGLEDLLYRARGPTAVGALELRDLDDGDLGGLGADGGVVWPRIDAVALVAAGLGRGHAARFAVALFLALAAEAQGKAADEEPGHEDGDHGDHHRGYGHTFWFALMSHWFSWGKTSLPVTRRARRISNRSATDASRHECSGVGSQPELGSRRAVLSCRRVQTADRGGSKGAEG
jgi:hypothetical protein